MKHGWVSEQYKNDYYMRESKWGNFTEQYKNDYYMRESKWGNFTTICNSFMWFLPDFYLLLGTPSTNLNGHHCVRLIVTILVATTSKIWLI